MVEAGLLGFLGASSLLVGAALTIGLHPSRRAIGNIMAIGAGTLISAVAYELVLEAARTGEGVRVATGLFTGALAFYLGDLYIDRRGGDDRKRSTGDQTAGSGMAIVLGTFLDGVPESFIIGLTLAGGGGVSPAFFAAVFLSNLPEAMSGTYGLSEAGWARHKLLAMWAGVALIASASAAIGFAVFSDPGTSAQGAFVQSFAAGALLTMLADTMMPEAFEFAGKTVGLLTVLGFGLAVWIASLE